MVRFGSVCSGIESASVAWIPLGWQPAWYAEIDKFPSKVLAVRHPDIPNLGNMLDIDADDPAVNQIDLLAGGTPCQAFSVAGLRKSLDDERGNLSLAFCRLARRIAGAGRLKTVVWENVPGVLNTKDNAFGCFLAGLVGESVPLVPGFDAGAKWTHAGCVYGPEGAAAWRTLDAQYVGLAQRRKRVFVVFCVGAWADPGQILFEWEGVRRDSPPSRETGERVAGTIAAGAHPSGFNGRDAERGSIIPIDMRQASRGDRMTNNRAEGSSGGAPGTGIGKDGDPAPTIAESHVPAVAFAQNQRDEVRQMDVAGALAGEPGMKQQTYIHQPFAFQTRCSRNGRGMPSDVTPTLTSCEGGTHADTKPHVATSAGVRRLTPLECERLQGFPDGYTAIDGAADGPRYRALGNSMAVPCMQWIGNRIERFLSGTEGSP